MHTICVSEHASEPVWADIEIKSCPSFSTVAQKVAKQLDLKSNGFYNCP